MEAPPPLLNDEPLLMDIDLIKSDKRRRSLLNILVPSDGKPEAYRHVLRQSRAPHAILIRPLTQSIVTQQLPYADSLVAAHS